MCNVASKKPKRTEFKDLPSWLACGNLGTLESMEAPYSLPISCTMHLFHQLFLIISFCNKQAI